MMQSASEELCVIGKGIIISLSKLCIYGFLCHVYIDNCCWNFVLEISPLHKASTRPVTIIIVQLMIEKTYVLSQYLVFFFLIYNFIFVFLNFKSVFWSF